MPHVDPAAARFAVWTRYPSPVEPHSEEYIVAWMAAQLLLKAQGRLHDDHTVAIYEEHAQQ